MKHCPRCDKDKETSEFGKASRRKDGLQNWCRSCISDYQKENPEKGRARNKAFRKRHPEAGARYLREVRWACIVHYSTTTVPSCACCRESEPAFLVLDHIDGGGGDERREFGRGIYNRIRKLGFPPGYQVLCWNCNAAKQYQGVCPHEVTRRALADSSPMDLLLQGATNEKATEIANAFSSHLNRPLIEVRSDDEVQRMYGDGSHLVLLDPVTEAAA